MKTKLTGLVLLIAFFILATTASAQFTIKVPKIPKIKIEQPKPGDGSPNNDGDPSSDSSSDSSSSSTTEVRGRPISGAKITFSNTPDGSNPKTSFTSSENIYGKIDFGGRTMYDAFGWKAMGERNFYYVSYFIKIMPAGEKGWEHNWHNGRTYTLVSKADAQKTYWNFDVLPDPTKASTISSAIADELQYYNSPAGMWPAIGDMDSARRTFPQNGNYAVDITIYGDSYDDWGKPAGEFEKFPTVSATLAFQFSGADGQRIASGYQKARDAIENAKNRKEMLHAMPDWWFKGATYPAEPKLSAARLVPLIKGFIGQWNLTYLKHMIVKSDGPLWVIEKNNLGIPEYRMVKPYIYVIYKDPKDNSCQVGALYMRESYAGAGTYGAPYLGGIREVQYIDCAVIK